MEQRLYLYDALSGKLRVASGQFMTVGSAETNTFQVHMKAKIGGTFTHRGDFWRFFPHGKVTKYSINGLHTERDLALEPDSMYLFVLQSGCFVCRYGGEEAAQEFRDFDSNLWYAYSLKNKAWSEPMSLPQICEKENELDPDTPVAFEGMRRCAFLFKDIIEVSRYAKTLPRFKDADKLKDPSRPLPAPKPLICPHCWESFPPRSVLSIATHPALRGDKILGKKAMQRFVPRLRDRSGVPLDEAGFPCHGIACPYCHGKLPTFFTRMHQHIITIAGMPRSGKTYYHLAMMSQVTQELSRSFGITFRPSESVSSPTFSQMSQKFLTSELPEQAYLPPTSEQGGLLQSVWKRNAFCYLPIPVVHGLSRNDKACSIVTYENSGDSFGTEHGATPPSYITTGHVEAASAIFFIFDPTRSNSFRRLLQQDGRNTTSFAQPSSASGQLRLLSSLEARLRTAHNQPPPAQLNIPIAFILNKSDAWSQLLGPEPLLPIIKNGKLSKSCIEANSERIHHLLFTIAPQLCSVAKAISTNVCYFAVSTLGKAPVKFLNNNGEEMIAPESGKIRPSHLTDPFLWALSILEPDLLPVTH